VQKLTYKEVQTNHKDAWEALPESYQADSCLTFFLDVNDGLCAEHDMGGEYCFCPIQKKWVRADESTPLYLSFPSRD
jgi:hypothetical protein